MNALLTILLVFNAFFLIHNAYLFFKENDATAGAIGLLNFAAVLSCAMALAA